jgi:hypothetical protein
VYVDVHLGRNQNINVGHPIYIWKDGKVVEVPPDKIITPEEKVCKEKKT